MTIGKYKIEKSSVATYLHIACLFLTFFALRSHNLWLLALCGVVAGCLLFDSIRESRRLRRHRRAIREKNRQDFPSPYHDHADPVFSLKGEYCGGAKVKENSLVSVQLIMPVLANHGHGTTYDELLASPVLRLPLSLLQEGKEFALAESTGFSPLAYLKVVSRKKFGEHFTVTVAVLPKWGLSSVSLFVSQAGAAGWRLLRLPEAGDFDPVPEQDVVEAPAQPQ